MTVVRSITSNSLRMMERSLEFLWTKQAAHMDNIANAETPTYRVKSVTFEERVNALLKAASEDKKPRKAIRDVLEETDWIADDDGEIVRMDDNGVNTTEQMLEAVRTAYQMQYVMKSISSDLSTLRSAIGGG